MKIKMVYKKLQSYVTIVSNFIKQDDDYVYLECGKYLRKNIAEWTVLIPDSSKKGDLTDDA